MSEQTLKPGWKRWHFDQMAINVNDRIDNPAEADVEHYVGLEHLDTDSLKIRRWGVPTDVEATKLRFRKGDIIFGRRRAYQRKLAVADFDGICSAHAMVLRAKTDVVLPEFLPFFMQSDLFMNRALEISVGSLSPTINWKTLATQEFALPPLEGQQKITKVLLALDQAVEAIDESVRLARVIETSYIDDTISRIENTGLIRKPLRDICTESAKYGANASAVEYDPNLPRFLRITDIDMDGNLLNSDIVSVQVNEPETYSIHRGDILFARTGNTVGKAYLTTGNEGNCVFAGYLVKFRPNPRIVKPEYLFYYTRSSSYTDWVKQTTRTGAQPNINGKEYSNLPILVPNIEEQTIVVNTINSLRESTKSLLQRRAITLNLKKHLLDWSSLQRGTNV